MVDPTSTPKGVVAIAADADGRVIASVSDFETERLSGDTVAQSQAYRANYILMGAVARACCNPDFAQAIETYHLDSIRKNLKKAGWRFTTVKICHEQDAD